MVVNETVVVDLNKSVTERVAVAGWERAESRFGKVVMWVSGEGGVKRLEDGVRGVTVGPISWGGKGCGCEASNNIFGVRVVGVEVREQKSGEEAVGDGG